MNALKYATFAAGIALAPVDVGGAEPSREMALADERAVIRIAQREAVGDGSMDRELLTMLSYPLVRISTSPQKQPPP